MPDTPGKVAIGYCYAQSTITPQWHRSYTFVLIRDAATNRRIVGEFAHEASGVHIPTARSSIVRDFLTHPEQPEWLWFVDTDASFGDDVLERLIAAADPETRPIVGALAFGVGVAKDAAGREVFNDVGAASLELFPTIFLYDDDKTLIVMDYPRDRLVQCHGTGAHCLLIHRSVLADPRWLEDGHPLPWFRTAVRCGQEVSEDQFFCMKAGSFGYPVHVDTSIKTGHVKTFVADEDLYLAQAPPEVIPPAEQQCAVIVPVLNRPQNAAPFMASLTASTDMATVYAACSEQADADAWEAAGAVVVRTDGTTFAEKVNEAYPWTDEPWIFLAGDDVRFHRGWLDQAEHVAVKTGADVIGTNDLGNARVMAGEHATHMLIRRTYIDEVGATWFDGPGVVCNESYAHWFVDAELVTAAKQRHTFQPALDSIVEHLHPLWGKAEPDATYRRGESTVKADQATFKALYRKSLANV